MQAKALYSQSASTTDHPPSSLTPPIQAKGYPDISTRAFLHHLATTHNPQKPALPIYCLVDYDPDGIAIMSTYKHGSWNLSHESSQVLVPSIQWLGVRSCDIVSSADGEEYKGVLRLSGRDRHKARKMLENNVVLGEEGRESEWRREVQVMLMLNVKAEMEVLAEREGGVAGWVEGRLLVQGRHDSRMVVDDEDDVMTTGSDDDDDLGR